MIEKLIMFEHAIETLGYFSKQLGAEFVQMGYRLYFVDFNNLSNDKIHLKKFMKSGNTALLTFNFVGLSGEAVFREKAGRSIWEDYGIPCFCIMVDHPLYYYDQLQQMGKRQNLKHCLITFCVDRGHVGYMHRFYPEIPCYFLPLAGNQLSGIGQSGGSEEDWIPFGDRKYEVALIANYMALPKLEEHFVNKTQEYIDFYYEILEELRENPDFPVDAVMEQIILREIPEASDEEICMAQHGMAFLDLYNRSYYREKVVKNLVDAGIKVHVFGKDWDKIRCGHPENLIASGRMLTSAECVKVIRESKVALNIMPWFKDGAHDRIFTAMLNGAVSLTDDSRYLREVLTDGRQVCFYSLRELAQLPEQVRRLLSGAQGTEALLEQGYKDAIEHHTWAVRAQELHLYIRNTNKI